MCHTDCIQASPIGDAFAMHVVENFDLLDAVIVVEPLFFDEPVIEGTNQIRV